MNTDAPVDLIFLWHHHQPDYRSPRDGVALLPWTRLHATKDYLDMARRLERHPGIKAAFNFVPSLVDQIEAAAGGAPDTLFDALARDPAELPPEIRAMVARRARTAPPWAFDRWPSYAALARRASSDRGVPLGDSEFLALETGFLLGWLDPMFQADPAAAAAIASYPRVSKAQRDALLALHHRLLGEVVPAYRGLAARGQVELSASPYHHPILPLLVDVRHALRARPETRLPPEPFQAAADADAQIERALARHEQVFGARPAGLWPSEGSVSPEVAEIAARRGVRWMASDETVLWRSLGSSRVGRERLYQPWQFATPAGAITLLFRDHELSDRIGFVYQRWEAEDAAADFIARVTRIGRDWEGAAPPLVSVILDGENCWEHYHEDGGPFLDALYRRLEETPAIRTCTPAEAIAARTAQPLETLHTGSWIDADFHIWIGHPEKNLAWDRVSRTRRALLDADVGPAASPRAWDALYTAEGSDWFWWFGDDHATEDRNTFDRLFREHLMAAYERASLAMPGELRVPIARTAAIAWTSPIGFVRPVVDGKETSFYEWHNAGRLEAGSGGAMHRDAGRLRRLLFGFDLDTLYLRIDPDGAPLEAVDLEFIEPQPMRLRISHLGGDGARIERIGGAPGESLAGARIAASRVIEIALPRAALGMTPGSEAALIAHRMVDGHPVESLPADDALRFTLGGADYPSRMWSA